MHAAGRIFVLTFVVGVVFSAPDVSLIRGVLQGVDENSAETQKPYHVYYGIPFAQAPVGSLRFQPPRPFYANNPNQVINSRDFKPACIQDSSGTQSAQSEDCLYLNVYTPSVGSSNVFDTNAGRKVMVWIHGGGFRSGDAVIYRPTRLVTDYDVIVVVIQYRLGILGFLSTNDEVLPGNMGLQDQIEALKWVKDNIRLFGGDANDVTIFGESAGGSSVALLSLSPLTEGLFTKAIMQSGTALSPWAVIPPKKSYDSFYQLADRADCLPTFYLLFTSSQRLAHHKAIVDCLGQTPAPQLQDLVDRNVKDVADKTLQDSSEFLNFGPAVDGNVLPRDPALLLNDEVYLTQIGSMDRKYVIGFNNNEYVINSQIFLQSKELKDKVSDIDDPFTQEYVRVNVQDLLPFPVTSEILNFAKFIYLFPRDWKNNVPLQGLLDLLSDLHFVVPAVKMARALVSLSRPPDVYLYLFDHYPERTDPDKTLEGSSHGLDMIFLFDGGKPLNDFFPGYGNFYSPRALPLLDVFRGSLTNMAKTGNPSRGGSAAWPRFDLQNESYMAVSPSPEKNQDTIYEGSTHGLELALLFDRSKALLKHFPGYGNLYTPSALPLLDVFRGSLTNMAKTGNPSRGGSAAWPRFDLQNESYMAVSPSPEVRQRVFERRVSF